MFVAAHGSALVSQCGSWLAPSVLAAERYQLAPSMWNLGLSRKEPILHSFLQSSAFGLQRVLLAMKRKLAMSIVGDCLRGC